MKNGAPAPAQRIPVAIGARRVRLSQTHVEALFGEKASLRSLVPLTQPAEFAATWTVEVRGPQGSVPYVRVVGPAQGRTVVELSARDFARVGLTAPARASSTTNGSPGCVLVGPKGSVVLAEGVVLAGRRLYASPSEAAALGLHDDQVVALQVVGERARVLRDVPLHVREGARLELYVDLDDAGSLDVSATTYATLADGTTS